MTVDEYIKKLLSFLTDKYSESHFAEISLVYHKKRKILVLIFDYPLADNIDLVLEAKIPKRNLKGTFELLEVYFVENINQFIKKQAKKYEQRHRT